VGCSDDDCRKTLTCPTVGATSGDGGGTSSSSGGASSTSSVGGTGGGGASDGGGGAAPTYIAQAVAAGDSHSCAIVEQGRVVCWGDNADGQLGDGSFLGSTTPVPVSNLDGVVELALGGKHSCALRTDGSVWCWGDATFRQIGQFTDSGVPVAVTGVTNAGGIAAGANHNCAFLNGGTAMCWGAGAAGQLGHGLNPSSLQPVMVDSLSSVSGVAAGADYSCGLDVNFAVYCWGSAGTVSSGNTPSVINFLGSPGPPLAGTDLATTDAFACALRVDKPWCWGEGYQRAAGEVNLPNVIALEDSSGHVCALVQGGAVYCWGANDAGQIGNGLAGGSVASPTEVSALPGPASSLGPGSHHTCAVVQGSVACWGDNSAGQLGNGSLQPSTTPVPVSFIP